MRIKLFRNRLARALAYCFLSTMFIYLCIDKQEVSSAFAVIFITTATMIAFRSEKIIDIGSKKKYRFSLLRTLFNLENIIYTILPPRFKDYSLYLLCFLLNGVFIFYINEFWLWAIFGSNILIFKIMEKCR